MSNPSDQKEMRRVQKEILACLNAKSDSRATSKELIGNIQCQAHILCRAIALLSEGNFIQGPEFSEDMISAGGDSNFRNSTQLTGDGQEKYIEMIREEQSG